MGLCAAFLAVIRLIPLAVTVTSVTSGTSTTLAYVVITDILFPASELILASVLKGLSVSVRMCDMLPHFFCDSGRILTEITSYLPKGKVIVQAFLYVDTV